MRLANGSRLKGDFYDSTTLCMHENTIGLKTAVFAPLSLSPSVSISLALYIQYLSLSAMTCQMFLPTMRSMLSFGQPVMTTSFSVRVLVMSCTQAGP